MTTTLLAFSLSCATSPMNLEDKQASAPAAEKNNVQPNETVKEHHSMNTMVKKKKDSSTHSADRYPAIADIFADPEGAATKKVSLRGLFQGWNDRCPESARITRSDWILRDQSGCIYVTGNLPAKLSPFKDKNEPVFVYATVALQDGKPYLEAHKVKVLPPLPQPK